VPSYDGQRPLWSALALVEDGKNEDRKMLQRIWEDLGLFIVVTLAV
jgi:hypothetical protein